MSLLSSVYICPGSYSEVEYPSVWMRHTVIGVSLLPVHS